MRLSWNEVRQRAARFADEWQDAAYERGETQSFYNEFFEVFGQRRRDVARYEQHVAKLDNSGGFIDLFWPGLLLVEQKSAGRDLGRAYEQAGSYFDGLATHERPRYILVSDFQTFELHDLDERDTIRFNLAELPQHVEDFGFIMGVQRRAYQDQDPASVKASELVGRFHDTLAATGYPEHDLERFLVRIVFCLFADDTGVFEPRDIFMEFIESRTSPDGADLGPWLVSLFQVLNTPETDRPSTLDEDLARFSYINGSLFGERLSVPSFDADMHEKLLDACRFDWSEISPAIFGALFQSVMDPQSRREHGAHYTTEQNILKVIGPLFMDALRDEFEGLRRRKDTRRRADLLRFQVKLSTRTFFDPACGCGNFLIIAYREIRTLELDVLKELYPQNERQLEDLSTSLSKVDVDQFYGIELFEFPARVAETALWMMDHLMNNDLSLAFGETCARIPLRAAPNIVHGDALEIDWTTVLPTEDCSYVFGNPPFGGSKTQTEHQRSQVRRIASLGGAGGTLDYVAAWFIKAGQYIQGTGARIGLVATNSITQGEQPAQLWPILFNRCGLEISYAHQTFAWGSDARGRAHVHVVIIGLDEASRAPSRKRLFCYTDINGDPQETTHRALSPYLFDASTLMNPHLTVKSEARPIDGMPKVIIGSKPIDGGHYIFATRQQRDDFVAKEPGASQLIRPYVGAKEYLHNRTRWILALQSAPPNLLATLTEVRNRMALVRQYRAGRCSAPTRKLADTPTLYHVNVLPDAPFLALPKVSSERREYVPIGWLEPPTIPSDLLFVLLEASLSQFAILTSAAHMTWLRHIGGRHESRYRYSIGLVYDTFPLPDGFLDGAHSEKLEPLSQAVLNERANHEDATLADLYDPDLMPPGLRKAHQRLDRAVDRLYKRNGFASERDRFEHLFTRYEQTVAPLSAATRAPKRRRR